MYAEDMSLAFSGSFPLRADAHCDTLTLLEEGKSRHIDVETMNRYMDMQFMAIFIEEDDAEKAAEKLERCYHFYRTVSTEEYYDLWIPLKNETGFARLERDNIGIVLALENCSALAVDDDAVYEAYDRGFRSFGLVWNGENRFGGGAFSDADLSFEGERLLRTCNRLPVAVDLAHANKKTFFSALDILEYPPIVTHTCCGLVYDHPRNLNEDQMKALRGAGGIMGITFVRDFLREDGENASFDDIIDHILYASDYVGLENIAFGSDFDGADMPEELADQSCLAALYLRMKERDFSEEEIAMISGGNLFRYMRATLGRKET